MVIGAFSEAVKIAFFNFCNGVYAYASGNSLAVGGAERQQWLLARALAAAGYSVTVGLQGIAGLEIGTTIAGVRFVSLPQSQTLTPYQRLLSFHRFLQSERPDWLYWRCASHLWGPVVTITKLAGVKTIFAAAFDTDVRPRHALVVRRGWWPLYAWGLSMTDRIFVQHRDQLSELSAKLRAKAFIVPNMVHMPARTKPHGERKTYVAWVGMLRQPKRPDLLLEIARKSPDLRFVVCGGPSEHRSYHGYGVRIAHALDALPNVDYRGQVPPDIADRIIANASVLLSTSEEEGFPNVFLEGWASGTPVVSLTFDPDQVIDRKKLGIVSGNVENAIADLGTLIDKPERREAISIRCRQYVADVHSETAVMTAVTQSLHDTVSPRCLNVIPGTYGAGFGAKDKSP
jgi:glycosyltransferase involved in cell wall biosynthesis